jgi:hypothetical protein
MMAVPIRNKKKNGGGVGPRLLRTHGKHEIAMRYSMLLVA